MGPGISLGQSRRSFSGTSRRLLVRSDDKEIVAKVECTAKEQLYGGIVPLPGIPESASESSQEFDTGDAGDGENSHGEV